MPQVHNSTPRYTQDTMAQTWTATLTLLSGPSPEQRRRRQGEVQILHTVDFVEPQSAIVSSSEEIYAPTHLLGLPLELRQKIWEAAADDMAADRNRSPWHQKPASQYRGLPFTCRQIYDEIQRSWYNKIVPWNRLQVLLKASVEQLNRTTIRNFRSLTIDIRLDADPGVFTGLQQFLWKAQPYLRELRLHFFGPDVKGKEVYVHGCGNHVQEVSEPRLFIDGQRLDHFLPLWQRIAALSQLETLVISNANLQLWDAMVLYKKPFLRNLSISSDPRSALHLQQNPRALGFLLTAGHRITEFPPIKVLRLSANTMITASIAVARVAPTLEHLTWTVPDISLQPSGFEVLWFDRTAHLLSVLARSAWNLQTLRICIAGSGIYQEPVYGALMGAFKEHLGHLSSLHHLELHFKNKCPWFGSELLAALPNNLRHLYVSDHVLESSDIMHAIWQRYLVSDYYAGAQKVGTTFLNEYRPQSDIVVPLPHAKDRGPWLIDPFTFGYIDQDEAQNNAIVFPHTLPNPITRHKSGGKPELKPEFQNGQSKLGAYFNEIFSCDLIGEHSFRQDYIPFSGGNLRFVHYEYGTDGSEEASDSQVAKLHQMLLVNGRLLDRDRNKHLRQFDGGNPIPPRVKRSRDWYSDRLDSSTQTDAETATGSGNILWAIMLHRVYAVEHSNPRPLSKFPTELECSRLWRPYEHYFGNEDRAMEVFDNEATASIEDLQPYTYPGVRDVVMDDQCHWVSPEMT